MFCSLGFIAGGIWGFSPAEFGPGITPGLCRFIEEEERVCPCDMEVGLGIFGGPWPGLVCPCQPCPGGPDMEFPLAPIMLG